MLVDVYHICLGATGALWLSSALQANSMSLTWEGLLIFTLVTVGLYGLAAHLQDY